MTEFPTEEMALTHILVVADAAVSRDWYYNPSSVDHAFTIRVPDCLAAYETLRSRSATFLTPPVDWGSEIRAFFRDPDGHLFEISQT